MSHVTVWLTSYNHEAFIAQTIESILGQSYSDFTLCIADDCSDDSSWEIIERFAAGDNRIRAIRSDVNTGGRFTAPLRHKDIIDGDYIAIAHSDDVWHPEKLAAQVEVLDTHPEVTACFTHVRIIGDDGNEISDKTHYLQNTFAVPNRPRLEWLRTFFLSGNCLCHPSSLIRWSRYNVLDLQTHGLNSLPDFCKWIRICCSDDIHLIEQPLTSFRVHTDNSNTSAFTPSVLNQTSIETFLVLREFERIGTVEEVLGAFPETRDYLPTSTYSNTDKRIIAFLLARFAIDNGPSRMHALYGIERLYELLQDPETESLLKDDFGYASREFRADKQLVDVFGATTMIDFLRGVLYVDFGNGFSEQDAFRCLAKTIDRRTALFEWDLAECCDGKNPVALRFDPDDRFMWKIRIVEASIDGKPIGMKATTSLQSNGDWDLFMTDDSSYALDRASQTGILRVVLEACPVQSGDVSALEPAQLKQLSSKGKRRFPFR